MAPMKAIRASQVGKVNKRKAGDSKRIEREAVISFLSDCGVTLNGMSNLADSWVDAPASSSVCQFVSCG